MKKKIQSLDSNYFECVNKFKMSNARKLIECNITIKQMFWAKEIRVQTKYPNLSLAPY